MRTAIVLADSQTTTWRPAFNLKLEWNQRAFVRNISIWHFLSCISFYISLPFVAGFCKENALHHSPFTIHHHTHKHITRYACIMCLSYVFMYDCVSLCVRSCYGNAVRYDMTSISVAKLYECISLSLSLPLCHFHPSPSFVAHAYRLNYTCSGRTSISGRKLLLLLLLLCMLRRYV